MTNELLKQLQENLARSLPRHAVYVLSQGQFSALRAEVERLERENERLREYYQASEAMEEIEREWRSHKADGLLDILNLTEKLTAVETRLYTARAALKENSHD